MYDVVVVGAGLAGLECARRLEESNLSTLVVEAEDEVGGRQRTDRIDGYLCDRGFAVVDPAYPALRPYLDELDLRPFLAGVLADSHGGTSSRYVRYLVRLFLLGTPGLPSRGIGTLPRIIAARVRGDIRTGERVETIDAAGSVTVRTTHGTHEARAVVLATDAHAASGLLGTAGHDVPTRPMRGLTTWWFSTEEPPHRLALLAVDGRRSPGRFPGPVWNCADMTAAAPTYAPIGRRLIQATTLHDRPEIPAGESEVRRHVGEIYGCDTSAWDLVVRHDIPRALPSMTPGGRSSQAPRVASGLYVCGDHRVHASIQGALESGHAAADAVVTDLRR